MWGLTEWRYVTRWSYWHRDDRCVLSTTRLRVQRTVTLPRWDPPETASDDLRRRWRDVVKSVHAHELEHVRITDERGREFRRELRSLGDRESGDRTSARVERLYEEATEDAVQRHELLDDLEQRSPLGRAFDREEVDAAYQPDDQSNDE